MPTFLAITTRGLHDVTAKEIEDQGIFVRQKSVRGIDFEGSWEECYLANLMLRTPSRIVLPVLDFPAYKPEDLYFNMKRHDFTKYITPEQKLVVDAAVKESALHDQRLVAMKVKDAIVDQFWEKFDRRPDVDKSAPDLIVLVRIVKNHVSISVDTSGIPLYKRGYREALGPAPLKENLAAGLIALTEWDETTPIVDPMCGSGTFLIEAALKASKVGPGTLRRSFGFQRHKTFQPDAFERALARATEHEIEEPAVHFYGFDQKSEAIKMARENAKRAGVDHLITFERASIEFLNPPVPKGMMVVNPPYGERMGDPHQIRDLYRDLSFVLKQRFKGWTCWLLSGNRDLTSLLQFKSSEIRNGDKNHQRCCQSRKRRENRPRRIPSDTVRPVFSSTSALVAAFMVFSPFLISDLGSNPSLF